MQYGATQVAERKRQAQATAAAASEAGLRELAEHADGGGAQVSGPLCPSVQLFRLGFA